MSETDATMQKVAVLWLSGARLADIRTLPEVEKLLDAGAMVELDPLPITGLQAQHYQVLSGKSPASFGFFDTLVSRNYAVTEEVTGRGSSPKLLPDLLRTIGWTVTYEETGLPSLVSRLRDLIQSVSDSPSCLIVKCAVSADLKETDTSAIVQALQLAREWVGEAGLLALLSDRQPAVVERFVNINNFLADMGVIERDGQGGQVNWSDSLAYCAGNGQLLVNQLGRDPQGAVHPQD